MRSFCLFFLVGFFSGCAGSSQSDSAGSSSTSESETSTSDSKTKSDENSCNEETQKQTGQLAITVVVADPYIECARVCADLNKNGFCDSDDPLSTFSRADGSAVFSKNAPAGTDLVLKENGNHNGVPYKLVLSAVIPHEGFKPLLSGKIYLTPLTTLDKMIASQGAIIGILKSAGLSEISTADIKADPMENIIGSFEAIDDSQAARIRANIAVYLLLRIFRSTDSLKNMSPEEILAQSSSGGTINRVLSVMVSIVKSALNDALFSAMKTQISPIPNAPPVTREDIVRTAVVIADKVADVGTTTANSTGNDIDQVLQAVQAIATRTNLESWSSEIGQKFYAIRNKSFLEEIKNFLPKTLRDALDCSSGTFVINESNVVECFQKAS